MPMREPWMDEQERQEKLEKHQSMFPVCEECGRLLMNSDKCFRIGLKWYCDWCAEVMTNSEMRESEGIDG